MTEMLMSVEALYTMDEDLFSKLLIPTGMDKETIVNSILLECMELEVLYPRPETMKNMIGIWSAKELPTWNRIRAAENEEYNPIENYDRHQTDTREETHSGNDVTAGTAESNTTGKTTGTSSGTSSGTTSGTSSGTSSGESSETKSGTTSGTSSGTSSGTTSGTTSGTSSGESSETRSGTLTGQNGTTTNATGSLTDNKLHKYASFDSNSLLDQSKDEQTAQSTNTQTEQSANEQRTSETVNQTTQGSTEQETSETVSQTTQGSNEQENSETTNQSTQGSSEQNQTGKVTENKVTTLTHGEKVGETFTSYIHGNIGVITSQQMLESELELAPKINTINYIVNSFKMRFCILVY